MGGDGDNLDLIPVEKLGEFLLWREKEFTEKIKGRRYDTAKDEYASIEAEDGNGLPMLAIINRGLMRWDAKASHPWMFIIEIKYDGDNPGMPEDDVYELMDDFENDLMELAPDSGCYLNLGRETFNELRTIYFACMEFRNSTRIVSALIANYKDRLTITFDVFKDKCWRVMNKYN